MTMKRKFLKISAFAVAVLLIMGVLVFANALVSNPITAFLARRTAEKYLEQAYADTDYRIDQVFYSFKDGKFHVNIKSPTHIDGDFELSVDMLGKPVWCDYEWRVTNHANVASRLFYEYKSMVEDIFNSPIYPYHSELNFGDLEFEWEVGFTPVENALKMSDLENDRFYNVAELAKTNGSIVLYVDDETVTPEKAAEILLTTRQLMDDAGIPFYSVHFVLQYPRYDETSLRSSDNINLRNFLYTDIYEEGLAERIKAADSGTKAYDK